MCGRFANPDKTQAEMLEIVEGFLYTSPVIDPDAPMVASGWNIKPTQHIRMIYQRDDDIVATAARWWFVPDWFKGSVKQWKPTTFNARIETAPEKPTFRKAWSSSHCIIPALGYYEWSGEKSDRRPNYITLDTNEPSIFIAGLHSVLADGTRTCTMLTREASPQIAHIHPRMPIILTSEEIKLWIGGKLATNVQSTLGTGWDGRFKFHEVRKFGRDDDDPALIEPIDRLI